jgi:hypothetical protein
MPADYDKLFRPVQHSDSDDDADFFDPNASYPPAPKGNGDTGPEPIDWSQPLAPPRAPAPGSPTAGSATPEPPPPPAATAARTPPVHT